MVTVSHVSLARTSLSPHRENSLKLAGKNFRTQFSFYTKISYPRKITLLYAKTEVILEPVPRIPQNPVPQNPLASTLWITNREKYRTISREGNPDMAP